MDIRERNFQQFLWDISRQDGVMTAKPLYLTVGLTNVCNYNCVFCTYCGVCAKKSRKREELDIRTIERLAEYFPAAAYICPSLRGEPFLYSRFDRFLEVIRPGADRMQLTNNGSQLHKYDLKKLQGINVVSISFDAADRKTFEALRCGADFEQMLRNIKKLREELPAAVLHFAVVVCRLNLHQLADIYRIARETGFNMITFNTIYGPKEDRVIQLLRLRESDRAVLEHQMEIIRQLNADQKLTVSDVTTFDGFEDGTPLDYDTVFEQLRQLKNTTVPYLDFDADALIGREDRRVHIECRSGRIAGFRLPYCMAPFMTMSILPDGKVEPCCAAYAAVDDLTDKPIDSVWNGENFKALRESMFDWKMLPDYCRHCKVFMRYDYINEYVDYLKGYGVCPKDIGIPPHYYPKREFVRDNVLWERICATQNEEQMQDAGTDGAGEKGQADMENINTKEYWEKRFSTGDWDKYDGERQSGFFSELALDSFPDWLKRDMSSHSWEVSDYGCAEGGGTAVLARYFPKCRFTGIDFSAAAIEIASGKYPYCEFKVGDITGEVEGADIIFCSNVLEHMKHPYKVFTEIISKARRHAVFLVPFRDMLNLSEHFYVFDSDFFPARSGSHALSYFRIIDCEEMGSPYWPGQQLVLVYSNPDAYDLSEQHLVDLFTYKDYDFFKQKLKEARALSEGNSAKAAALEDEKQSLALEIEQVRQEKQSLAAQFDQEREEARRLAAQLEQECLERQGQAAQFERERQEMQGMITRLGQERQEMIAQGEQACAERQELLLRIEQASQEKQSLVDQAAAAEKRCKTLTFRLENQADELKYYLEKTEELESELHEKERQAALLEKSNNDLICRNDSILRLQHAAVMQIHAMLQSRLFKMLHFLNRFRRQGFHRSREERRKFRKWLFSRFRHMPDRDHRYHPLFTLLEILEKDEANTPAPIEIAAASGVLERIKPEIGKLRRHLEEQSQLLDETMGRPLSEEAQKIREIIRQREYKGILIYPHVVFWEPLQTPQQLLRAFAKEGWLCFFCEAPWVEDACREVEPNLWITYEADLLQALGDTPVTVLLTWIGSMAFVERIENKSIWYHILDHLEIFSYYDHYYQKLHDAVVEDAQTVSYVSTPLEVECRGRQDAVYLANGVNPEEMENTNPDFIPKDMLPILERGHKIVGYYGYLAEWMDYELVRQMALARPEYEFVFIGKAIHDVSLIEGLKNVHLLGLKPYRELFEYAKFFDVATIPFRIDEKMDCVSPIKFYEYLALGLPVVASQMKELDCFAQQHDFISTAKGVDEFLFYVDSMMQPKVHENAKKYGKGIAWQNSWTERAKQMEYCLLKADYSALGQVYNKPDIIILSIIDYTFRHQRPQHFAQRFAGSGHRVFYVNANFGSEYTADRLEENLWQITLPNAEAFSIHLTDWAKHQDDMCTILNQFVREWFIRDAFVVVDYPNWFFAAYYLRERYGFKMITDYMDDFTGFLNPAEDMVRKNCVRLLEESDAVIASSQFLYDIAVRYNAQVSILRNGTEYGYFHKAFQPGRPTGGKKVIGYYGAIAEWFHAEIVCQCARKFPECDVILVGNVTAHRAELEKVDNIRLIGEVPYQQLLPWLESFDVCLIPFDTSTDLIKATNPVKFYEYLSAGKKIVATRIPELEPYQDRFVYLENDAEAFCGKVRACLDGTDHLATAQECFAFAQENDWNCRAEKFRMAALETFPKISIVVLCYNQLAYTKECVESVLHKTAYPNYELILVDNHSDDETPAYLVGLDEKYSQIKVILNQTNRGFAGGNNDGLRVADGDYLVLLNNDAVVTRGWLTGLLKHFNGAEPVGLVGPVTNSISNEAKIHTNYKKMSEMDSFAYEYTQLHMGEEYPHSGALAMFCLMMSRELYETIGPLDENYGKGMFEDDDYTIAAQRQGYRTILAEDVFIHHYGSVSFKKLEDAEYMKLFEENRRYFEDKWKIKWKNHTTR